MITKIQIHHTHFFPIFEHHEAFKLAVTKMLALFFNMCSNLGSHKMQKGAICQYLFRWIYYSHSSNSTERRLAKRPSVKWSALKWYFDITGGIYLWNVVWQSSAQLMSWVETQGSSMSLVCFMPFWHNFEVFLLAFSSTLNKPFLLLIELLN